jgi:hypothetical protein
MPGTANFDIAFDGTKLIWTVITFNGNQKTSAASNASSTSSRCSSKTLTTTATMGTASGLRLDSLNDQQGKIALYPNPATNTVTIYTNGISVSDRDIQLIDVQGRAFPAARVTKAGPYSIQLDISNLGRGIYWVKIRTGDTFKVLQLIKL